MNDCEKIELLNTLLSSFGFSYDPDEDLITSTLDAWQREFGYRTLFDETVHHFNMVFDCEPVHFTYQNQTWRIEFWKGQYGINIGSEIGIYRSDTVLSPSQYEQAAFQSVSDEQLLPLSMELFYRGERLFTISHLHWWLTGFHVGSFCHPEDLVLRASVIFPDNRMLQSFIESLLQIGYRRCDLHICGLTVSFTISSPHTFQPRVLSAWRVRFSQWKNRIFCNLYQLVTRPFSCTLDKILYLYYFLPFAFRHTLLFRRNHRQKFHRRRL